MDALLFVQWRGEARGGADEEAAELWRELLQHCAATRVALRPYAEFEATLAEILGLVQVL